MAVTVIGSGGGSKYLPLTGGVLTGSVTIDVDNNDTISMIANDEKSTLAQMQVQAGNASYAALDLYNNINEELTLAARRSNTSLQMKATNTALVRLLRYGAEGNQTASVSMAATASRGVVSGLTEPIGGSDATNKEYVDMKTVPWFMQYSQDGKYLGFGDGFIVDSAVPWRIKITPDVYTVKITVSFNTNSVRGENGSYIYRQ